MKTKRLIASNFITYNTYACIEINGHSLLNIINQLRNDDSQNLFCPWLFNSQTCESFFRALRSMTSTFSTVVNFSILDTIHRIRRIDMQTDIVTNLGRKGYLFRNKHSSNESTYIDLPSLQDIEEIVLNARHDAKISLLDMGMQYFNPTFKVMLKEIDPDPSTDHSESDYTTEDAEIRGKIISMVIPKILKTYI